MPLTVPRGLDGKHEPGQPKWWGLCKWCGVIGPVTRDHLYPKWQRHQGGFESHIVPACETCNNRRHDQSVDLWVAWLLSAEGAAYVARRHSNGTRRRRDYVLQACEVPACKSAGLLLRCTSPNGRERHFCAAHKPCGVLRRKMLVLGDGPMSVWSPLGL